MKDKIIEAAGKTWRILGENGETTISELSKILKEKEEIVFQAIGWLAREDKINYTSKNNKTFVSLVDSEMQSFKRVIQEVPAKSTRTTAKTANTRWIL